MTLLTENDPVKVLLSVHAPPPHVLIKQIAVKPLDRGVLKAWVTCTGVLTYWLYESGKLPISVEPQLQVDFGDKL